MAGRIFGGFKPFGLLYRKESMNTVRPSLLNPDASHDDTRHFQHQKPDPKNKTAQSRGFRSFLFRFYFRFSYILFPLIPFNSLRANASRFTWRLTEITVRVNESPPLLMRSTTCLCVAPSTPTWFTSRIRSPEKNIIDIQL